MHYREIYYTFAAWKKVRNIEQYSFTKTILINGFQKKTEKTPKSEIEKALKIKAEYEQDKQ